MASMNLRHAANASPRVSPDRSSPPRPTSGRRWRPTQARSPSSGRSPTTSSSFAAAASAASDSRIPACAFTISPSAQYETPSPYGRQRPCFHVISSSSSSTTRRQLVHEPALADARDADERDELRRSLAARAREHVDEEVELAIASDERRPPRTAQVDTEPGARLERFPDGNGSTLPFASIAIGVAVDDLTFGRRMGLLADENPVDGRRRLDTSSGVDDVSSDHRLAFARRRVERDECLAGVHRDPDVQVPIGLVLVQPSDRVTHGECRSHRALRIVLVRHRCPEHGDDRVADELLHGSAEALELVRRARGTRAAVRERPRDRSSRRGPSSPRGRRTRR